MNQNRCVTWLFVLWQWHTLLSASALDSTSTIRPTYLLTYFSSGFSHHVGSPVWLMIFLLHIALSVSSPALSPVLFRSRWHASFHLVFGRPLFLFPGISALNTFLSMCSPSLLITCPYQINLLSVIFLEACATLFVPRMCSFLILSLRVTPHIHRSILISVTSIRFSCLFVVAHVSDSTSTILMSNLHCVRVVT